LDVLLNSISFLVIDGIAYGMVLFVISIGLAITMGLMRVVNLAHGAFAAFGGYIGIKAVNALGVPFPLGLLIAFVGTALVSVVLERLLYVHLYKASELEQVLMTVGLILVSIATFNLLFGSQSLPVKLPPYLSGPLDLGFREVPRYRVFLIAVGLALMIGLWLLLDRTRFGAQIRAAVDNRHMAESMGIDVMRLFTITFALGSGMAGLGGALGAEILPLEPVYPFKHLLTFLIVVSVAGFGNIKAVALVSLLLGLVDTAGRVFVPAYGAFVIYLTMIAILLWRPNGLFNRS
jgi:branched-chain amino acid transport system permease protein